MKALSIHQPWAWAILHAGKRVENRTWPTRHRGPLLIHASKSRRSSDAWPVEEWHERFGVERPPWAELPTGALVGVVEVVACLPLAEWKGWHADGDPRATHPEAMTSPWAEGPWCWVLAEPKVFEKPVPRKGQQNLFEVGEGKVRGLGLSCEHGEIATRGDDERASRLREPARPQLARAILADA